MTEKIKPKTVFQLIAAGTFFLLAARPTYWLINSDELASLDSQASKDALIGLLLEYSYIKIAIVLVIIVLSLIQNRKANLSYLNSLVVGIAITLLARFDLFHASEMILGKLAFGDFEISLVVAIVLTNSIGCIIYWRTLTTNGQLVR